MCKISQVFGAVDDVPPVGLSKFTNQVEERRFSCAIAPQYTSNLTWRKMQVEVVQQRVAFVRESQVVKGKDAHSVTTPDGLYSEMIRRHTKADQCEGERHWENCQ